jgi:bacteriophage CI repressor
MDLNSRVQKIINYSELSSSEFADEIGVQRSNISHVLSGRNKPSLDFLMKIKDRFPEIQWEWLIEGKGAMVFSENEAASTPSSYLLEESKINDDEPIITGLFSIPSQEIDENTKQEEEKSEISEPIQYNNIVENTPEISENKSIPEVETPSEKGNSIKKIVFFYENGKFEVFEP